MTMTNTDKDPEELDHSYMAGKKVELYTDFGEEGDIFSQ